MQKQKGFTFWGFVFTVGPIIVVALLAMLLFPAYAEYFAIKKAINRIGAEPTLQSMSDGDIRAMMEKTMEIDFEIKSIKSSDLVIQRNERSGTTVSVDYEVVVPLVANISALLDFSATTNKNSTALAAAAN
jgi:Tfp pilus assembly protein PilE